MLLKYYEWEPAMVMRVITARQNEDRRGMLALCHQMRREVQGHIEALGGEPAKRRRIDTRKYNGDNRKQRLYSARERLRKYGYRVDARTKLVQVTPDTQRHPVLEYNYGQRFGMVFQDPLGMGL